MRNIGFYNQVSKRKHGGNVVFSNLAEFGKGECVSDVFFFKFNPGHRVLFIEPQQIKRVAE